ncbi:hypothetical protein LINPERHAP2_LOCUS15526 [Linum perenne]
MTVIQMIMVLCDLDDTIPRVDLGDKMENDDDDDEEVNVDLRDDYNEGGDDIHDEGGNGERQYVPDVNKVE